MASTDKPDTEQGKGVPPPPPGAPPTAQDFAVDVALRVLLLASAVTAIAVLVTSDQKKTLPGPALRDAKFRNSPAFIYFLVALCVTGLYSIITLLASISVMMKPDFSLKFLLHFALWDVLMLGILASATGAAAAIAYLGLKGDDHLRWMMVCNTYDKFCRYLAASLAVSLFGSVVLVLLVWFAIHSLHRRVPA